MKLRIDRQNIRFRLSIEDLEHLSNSGKITETLHLSPDISWIYSVEAADMIDEPNVETEVRSLRILMPEKSLKAWLASHEVEWHFEWHVENANLSVDIEKDLKPNRH